MARLPRALEQRGGETGPLPDCPLRRPWGRCLRCARGGVGLYPRPTRRRLRSSGHGGIPEGSGARCRPRLGRGDTVGVHQPSAGGRPCRVLHLDIRSGPRPSEPLSARRTRPPVPAEAVRPGAVAGAALQLHGVFSDSAGTGSNAGLPRRGRPTVRYQRGAAVSASPSGPHLRRRRGQRYEDLPGELPARAAQSFSGCSPRSPGERAGAATGQHPRPVRAALCL